MHLGVEQRPLSRSHATLFHRLLYHKEGCRLDSPTRLIISCIRKGESAALLAPDRHNGAHQSHSLTLSLSFAGGLDLRRSRATDCRPRTTPCKTECTTNTPTPSVRAAGAGEALPASRPTCSSTTTTSWRPPRPPTTPRPSSSRRRPSGRGRRRRSPRGRSTSARSSARRPSLPRAVPRLQRPRSRPRRRCQRPQSHPRQPFLVQT